MGPSKAAEPLPAQEIKSDPRWQLIERILRTNPFQKSANLRALLSYLAEHSLGEQHDALSERQIGIAVFGKAVDYSPAEDSAVRVHARQLRLRLHEYFALEGRDETLAVEIPKGSYLLEFHPAHNSLKLVADSSVAVAPIPTKTEPPVLWRILFVAAFCAALVCAFGWYRAAQKGSGGTVPWPLNAVIQRDQRTTIVVSDSNSMLRLLSDKEMTLEQYLDPNYREKLIPAHTDAKTSRLLKYILGSQLTSRADLVDATILMKLAGANADRVALCSARDLNQHDLEQGNFVFVGGPTSNPWVSLFRDQLNFEEVEDGVGGKMYFRNKKPLPGEQSTYEGLAQTGSAGDEYATVALLPASSGQGNVLILQGLRQEGTEALGILLADATDRAQLAQVLGIREDRQGPHYFEALIRARAVAGAPVSISVVATRTIPSPAH